MTMITGFKLFIYSMNTHEMTDEGVGMFVYESISDQRSWSLLHSLNLPCRHLWCPQNMYGGIRHVRIIAAETLAPLVVAQSVWGRVTTGTKQALSHLVMQDWGLHVHHRTPTHTHTEDY